MDGRRTNWDENTTKIFLDLCIAEKNKLNYNKKGWTKLVWQNLYRNFRQQTRRAYDSKQLQNKFNSLKRQYKLWRKLRDKNGAGWDNNTRTITCDEDWWEDQIAENREAEQFHGKALPYEDELTILFRSMDGDDGTILCVSGIGDMTPTHGGSEENLAPTSENNANWLEDNIGRSSVGHVAQRSGKEVVVDSPPPKKSKSMEYYVEHISESMLERSRNEKSAMRREQEEVTELLQLVEEDGVSQGSELYFIATELFRSTTRHAAFKCINLPEHRIAWL